MAKKQNLTQKLRSKVKRQIRAIEKRGYEVPETVKERIEKANYSRLKSYENEKYKRLYSESRYIDTETGEILSGTKAKLLRKSNKNNIKNTTTNAGYTEVDFSDLAGTFDPETGEIFEVDQVTENVIEDLMNKLDQEIPEYYYLPDGRKRYVNEKIRNEIDAYKDKLKDELNEALDDEDSKRELARRIQNTGSEISDLADKLNSYYDTERTIAFHRLESIIAGHSFNAQELSTMDAYTDMINGYNEPD